MPDLLEAVLAHGRGASAWATTSCGRHYAIVLLSEDPYLPKNGLPVGIVRREI